MDCALVSAIARLTNSRSAASSLKRVYDQEGHAILPVSIDVKPQCTVITAVDLTIEVGGNESHARLR
jgi:hypothetical protein